MRPYVYWRSGCWLVGVEWTDLYVAVQLGPLTFEWTRADRHGVR